MNKYVIAELLRDEECHSVFALIEEGDHPKILITAKYADELGAKAGVTIDISLAPFPADKVLDGEEISYAIENLAAEMLIADHAGRPILTKPIDQIDLRHFWRALVGQEWHSTGKQVEDIRSELPN